MGRRALRPRSPRTCRRVAADILAGSSHGRIARPTPRAGDGRARRRDRHDRACGRAGIDGRSRRGARRARRRAAGPSSSGSRRSSSSPTSSRRRGSSRSLAPGRATVGPRRLRAPGPLAEQRRALRPLPRPGDPVRARLDRRRRPDRLVTTARPGATRCCRSRSGCCSAAPSATWLDRFRFGYVVDFVDARHRRPPVLHVQRRRCGDQLCADPVAAHVRSSRRRLGMPGEAATDRTTCPRPAAGPMPEAPVAPGIRTVRVPDGSTGRIDRFVADATGLSRSHVQKLISDGRLTVDGVPVRANALVPVGAEVRLDVPEPRRARPRAGPRHPAARSSTRTTTC